MRTHTRLVALAALILLLAPSAFADDAQSAADTVTEVLCDIYEAVGGSCDPEPIDGDDDPDPEIGPSVDPGG